MMVDLSAIPAWIAILISLSALSYTVVSNRTKGTTTQIEQLKLLIEDKASKHTVAVLTGKVDIAEDKITVIQNEIKHLPSKEATHQLERSLLEIKAEMRGLSEQMKPIGHMAARMQEVLLDKTFNGSESRS